MYIWILLYVFICDRLFLADAGEIFPGNWDSCMKPEAGGDAIRVDTEERLQNLRREMRNDRVDVDAYIISDRDFHLNEFVSDHDRRLQFISGFSGSQGRAVVTQGSAALWTDGRYFLQAEQQLGCNWILMRQGEPGVPSMFEWLELERQKNEKSLLKVGACPYFISVDAWAELGGSRAGSNLKLNPVWRDLVDKIWTKNRPSLPSTVINNLPFRYTGDSWTSKMKFVKMKMVAASADMLVITSLHEIAWVLNLRASDISGVVFDPVFYALLIIRAGDTNPVLYLKDHERKLDEKPQDPVSTVTLREHLNLQDNGVCPPGNISCVKVREYDNQNNYQIFFRELTQLSSLDSVKRIWISYMSNYGVYSNLPQYKVFLDNTPIGLMKAQKNPVEVEGMKTAHIRDGTALARFMTQLEKEVKSGGENWTEVTELSASKQLTYYRSLQEDSRGDSFTAISSFGPHSAINHYFPRDETDVNITTESTYLLDSGGQYLGGTTDVTRTFLFRDPTNYEKECYTRVLQGHINLATAVFEKGLYGFEVDALAREPLWDVGLVYRHGTGHGIGHFLSVHEGPARISSYKKNRVQDVPLEENMFFSNEPGFYEPGKFGIRLENIMYVTPVVTKYKFPGATMFGFETITLFPYEPHMINWSMLDDEQRTWLYDYHEEVELKVGKLLKEQGDMEAYDWLTARTSLKFMEESNSVTSILCSTSLVLMAALASLCTVFHV